MPKDKVMQKLERSGYTSVTGLHADVLGRQGCKEREDNGVPCRPGVFPESLTARAKAVARRSLQQRTELRDGGSSIGLPVSNCASIVQRGA